MDKLTALLEEHRLDIDSSDSVTFGCACGWGYKQVVVTLDEHQAHLAEMLREMLAEVWYEGHTTYRDREVGDCRCGAWHAGECGCGNYGTGKIITINPYTTKETN